MGLVWRCDRCRKVSDLGIAYEDNTAGENEPPDGWRRYTMPVRGSTGRCSTEDVWLCNPCEDSLYEWLHQADYFGRSDGSDE